jgi:hypothetical protein
MQRPTLRWYTSRTYRFANTGSVPVLIISLYHLARRLSSRVSRSFLDSIGSGLSLSLPCIGAFLLGIFLANSFGGIRAHGAKMLVAGAGMIEVGRVNGLSEE